MKWQYITKQGDTWDKLAKLIYGSEKLAYVLLQANSKYQHLIYLPSGLQIIVPQTPKNQINSAKPTPPWIDSPTSQGGTKGGPI